jgi:UDP-glucose:(heptosyl)LPS alpha-1,3-glucosyltransferase
MWQRQLAGAAWWARPLKRVACQRLPQYRQQAELARRQLDESDSIAIAFSEMVASDYRSIHGLPSDRIRVVYPGVDVKKYTPHIRKLRRETTRKKLGIEAKELLLLAVADKNQQAAWRFTFRAMGRLIGKRLPVHLVIIADRHAAPASKLAGRFGVAQRVKVIEEDADRIPYYAAADVLLLPTLYAPFSAAALEAAACGLPCITTCQNGASDLLTEETDGFILERYSATDLADRIELFLDSARRERMGLAARRTAMKYPLDRSIDKIVQIYEEIVEGRTQVERRERDILGLPRDAGQGSVARRAA